MNIDDLKNVSLSHGTMRTEDLIPCFISAIRQIDPENRPLMRSMKELETEMVLDEYYEKEGCQLDLDYLFSTLDVMAPEGYYFGAHPGDGSDYGFWENIDLDIEKE